MLKEKHKVDFPEAELKVIGSVAAGDFKFDDSVKFRVDEVTGELVKVASPPEGKLVTTTITDVDGEIIYSTTRAKKYLNGSGFVISYTERMSEFLTKVTTGSVVRVFLYIAHHQNYGTDGKTFGYRCSHKYLWQVLRMNRATLWDALKYLRDNYLVHVGKVEGYTEFMVNPDYVTIGQDKKARRAEWNRRWAETFKRQKKV